MEVRYVRCNCGLNLYQHRFQGTQLGAPAGRGGRGLGRGRWHISLPTLFRPTTIPPPSPLLVSTRRKPLAKIKQGSVQCNREGLISLKLRTFAYLLGLRVTFSGIPLRKCEGACSSNIQLPDVMASKHRENQMANY